MRISSSLTTVALAISTLSSYTAFGSIYEPPTGAVFSNAGSVSQLSPRVVLNYVFDCVVSSSSSLNVATKVTQLLPDCLWDNYIDKQFPEPIFGTDYVCTRPNIDVDDIDINLRAANVHCPDGEGFTGNSFDEPTILLVETLYDQSADSCWAKLCEDGQEEDPEDEDEDDSGVVLRIESYFLETCSGIDLPYPTASVELPSSLVPPDASDRADATLTCMLDRVMNNPASDFGLDEPSVPCYPPVAHDNLQDVCMESLAGPAYEMCNNDFTHVLDHMSSVLDAELFSMSMSMPHDDDDEDELMLLERFCSILDSLTTDEGLECLDAICTADVTSSMPSTSPSPTTPSPTAAPSASLNDPELPTATSGAVLPVVTCALALFVVPLALVA